MSRFFRDGRIVVPKMWMPFGAGPRICIGMVFATTEIFIVLRILLARYRITLQGQAPQPVGQVVLLPAFEPSFKLMRLLDMSYRWRPADGCCRGQEQARYRRFRVLGTSSPVSATANGELVKAPA